MASREFPADWQRRRKAVLARDKYRCQIDGVQCLGTATEVDHIVRRVDGGSHDLANLRAACRPCNLAREGKLSRKPSRDWYRIR